MSVYVSICPGCKKHIGVARPGSQADNFEGDDETESDILTECPFCGKNVSSAAGFEMKEPADKVEPFNLLSVD